MSRGTTLPASFRSIVASQEALKETVQPSVQLDPKPELYDTDNDEADPSEDPLCPSVRLTKAKKCELRKPWYIQIRKRLDQMWSLKGTLTLIDIGNAHCGMILKCGRLQPCVVGRPLDDWG
ncbi:hypothetical protein V2J09_001383 [Rumex salicifolius]